MITLARSVFLYPEFDKHGSPKGEATRAPAGIPVKVHNISTSGRGKKKSTRLFIGTDAPEGWGEFSKRDYFGWVEESDVSEFDTKMKKNPRRRRGTFGSWHQRQAGPVQLFHESNWTVATETAAGGGLMRFKSESEAKNYLENVKKHNPGITAYIIPPSFKQNPSGGVRIVFNKLLGGWYIVRGPHQTPISGRFNSKEEAKAWLEIPVQMRGKKNPRQRVTRSARRPAFSRRELKPIARAQIGSPNAKHRVQVQRGKTWITLGAFVNKPMAVNYAQALADQYPRKHFRVWWPDVKKNPARRDEKTSSPQFKPGTPLTPTQKRAALAARKRWHAYYGIPARKNPESRAEKEAADLLHSFTGHEAQRIQSVNVPRHEAALAVGPLLAVAYETTRDGKREKYMHEFRREARPTLAASHDGRSLYLLGGAYRFTERGIVDK